METLVNLFKILSDETRLRIVIVLAQKECCVCELCGVLDISQPKVSKSLSKLRDVNLVADDRKEKFVYYSLKVENVELEIVTRSILQHLDQYPILMNDQKRLKKKEKFKKGCLIGKEQEISE